MFPERRGNRRNPALSRWELGIRVSLCFKKVFPTLQAGIPPVVPRIRGGIPTQRTARCQQKYLLRRPTEKRQEDSSLTTERSKEEASRSAFYLPGDNFLTIGGTADMSIETHTHRRLTAHFKRTHPSTSRHGIRSSLVFQFELHTLRLASLPRFSSWPVR
jgi:hypothetical protein